MTALTVAIPDLRQYDLGAPRSASLTFRQCLSHQTHLPAVEPLYTYGLDPATLRAFILQRVVAAPARRSIPTSISCCWASPSSG